MKGFKRKPSSRRMRLYTEVKARVTLRTKVMTKTFAVLPYNYCVDYNKD
jgi:hypothetical protein